ncbi:MAG: SRPBCC family protein [Pyrinomonadaceae bacterium]
MSVEAKAEIVIEKPRAEVAKIMFDPKSDRLWIGGLTGVFPMASGLLKKDSRVNRDGTFLGRQYSAKLLVIRDEPEKMLEISADEPFESKIRYDLEDAEGGTKVKLRVQGIVDGQYLQPTAVINRTLKESLETDLKKLKKHAELQSD